MADNNDNNKEAVEEQKRQSFLLKRISAKLDEARKEEAQAKEDLEKSMTAFPPAVLKGNKELQQTVARMRSDLRETIEAVSEEVANLETEEIAEQQKSQRKEEQRELIEKYGTWFEKLQFSIEQFSEEIREKTKSAFEDILGMDFKEKFFEGVNAISKGINKLGEKIGGLLSKGAGKVGGWLSTFFDILKQGAMLAVGLVAFTSFLEGWEKATKWFGENATIGDQIASALANILASFLGLEENEAKKLAEGMAGVFNWIGEWVQTFFKDFFGGAKDVVMGFIDGDRERLGEGIKKIFDAIKDAFFSFADVILTTLFGEEKSNSILKPLSDAFDKIFSIGAEIFNIAENLWNLLTGEGGSWSEIGNSFSNIAGQILGVVDDIIMALAATFDVTEQVNAIKTFFKQIISGIIEGINFLLPSALEIENPYKFVDEDLGIEVGAGASFRQLEEAIASNQNLTEEEKQREIDRMTSAAAGGMSIQQYVSNNASNQVITAPFRTQPGRSNEAIIQDHTTDIYAPAGA